MSLRRFMRAAKKVWVWRLYWSCHRPIAEFRLIPKTGRASSVHFIEPACTAFPTTSFFECPSTNVSVLRWPITIGVPAIGVGARGHDDQCHERSTARPLKA